MAFELKILEKGHCPRCNAIAEYRLRRRESTKLIPVYVVCPMCKLDKYAYTVSPREIKQKRTLQKLYKLLEDHPRHEKDIIARIKMLERSML